MKVAICDPGVGATNIARELGWIGKIYTWGIFQWLIPPWKGACSIAFAAASEKIDRMASGVMICDCKEKKVIERILVEEEQEAIYQITKKLLERICENGTIRS